MTQTKSQPFDPLIVPLKGSNLIEASAGTGKTYSIAILVLRLILEEKISIKEILMVTFTKAAVSELEERIRKFVRSAYRCAQGEIIEDEIIYNLIKKSISDIGIDKTSDLLKEAIVYLDETSVMTIHSFCQQTLTSFAFETNQLFGADLLQDTSSILEEQVKKFWRKNITIIQPELLALLIENNLSRQSISKVVNQHLQGKRFFKYDSKSEYTFCEEDHLKFLDEINVVKKEADKLWESLIQSLIDNSDALKEKSSKNRYAKKGALQLIDEPEKFLNFILDKRAKSAYIVELYDDILQGCDVCEEAKNKIQNVITNCLNQIYCVAIKEIESGVKNYKLSSNQMSFDDLIVNLHSAIAERDNPALVAALQQQYKAVFIDEFQDTDKLQYEIFQKAFGKNTILFYIGDPKQSIYAWRKADIFTYFRACNDVDNLYEMNVNYRSTKDFIDAMNQFFLPNENFDTFNFENEEKGEGREKAKHHKIEYTVVESPKNNTKGQLTFGGERVIPISINTQSNKTKIATEVAMQVADLLSNEGFKINDRKITPSDIGILVRSKYDGNTIKNALSVYGIPSVTITDAKVLQSNEANELLYVLQAIMENTSANINRALLTSFTGYNTGDVLSVDSEKTALLFKNYKNDWEENGIYTALKTFINDFSMYKNLLERNTENGERIITNLYQLIELLFKTQSIKNLSPLELIDWLKRGIEKDDAEGDELEQRIDTDEEAVRIVTIHSSKGLQYPIVLAPSLDLLTKSKHEECFFRDEETSEYISALKGQLDEKQTEVYTRQIEQENRRLIYVAITRAIYKCFIYKNTNSREPFNYANSSLSFFTKECAESSLITLTNPEFNPEILQYSPGNGPAIQHLKPTVIFDLLQKNWNRMSYTMLASHLERPSRRPFRGSKDAYDNFIFNQLTRGNISGNLLHFIFENLNFSDDSKWAVIIERAIKRFAPGQKEVYEMYLPEIVAHVLNADMQTGNDNFNLANINFEKRLHELEFDFPVSLFNPSLLSEFTDENISINIKSFGEMEGMMNGKIDLLFENENKYYVLDWKSTYLGDTLKDYGAQSLALAMNENNYHLQYLIYTVAVKKYLESRLPAFDYEKDFGGVFYCFVRGMRHESNNGVFWSKPALAVIEKMEAMFNVNKQLLQM